MVRRYTAEPVDPDSLARIAAAITSGPTAGNTRGVAVVVVTDPDARRAVADLAGEAEYVARGFDPWLSDAPGLLVVCAEPERYRSRYREADKDPAALAIPWWWVDAGAAMALGALAAVDEGLAAGFLGGHRLGGIHDLLGIPGDVEIVGVLTVGHPAPDRRSSSLDRPGKGDRIHEHRWNPGAG